MHLPRFQLQAPEIKSLYGPNGYSEQLGNDAAYPGSVVKIGQMEMWL